MALRGYRRLPGSARRYLTPSGREISHYEYRSRQARQQGFRNYGEIRKYRQTKTGRALSFKIRSAGGRVADHDSDIREFQQAGGWDAVHAGTADTSKGGIVDRLLTAIGARDPDWDWAVGETPKGVTA